MLMLLGASKMDARSDRGQGNGQVDERVGVLGQQCGVDGLDALADHSALDLKRKWELEAGFGESGCVRVVNPQIWLPNGC